MFGMRAPFATQFEPFARVQLRQVADDRDQFVLGIPEGQHPFAVGAQAQDGVAVFFVVVGNTLDGAADTLFAKTAHGKILSHSLFIRQELVGTERNSGELKRLFTREHEMDVTIELVLVFLCVLCISAVNFYGKTKNRFV
jgi:hypothetical protein